MAETIEEIAALIKSIKIDNEVNNEDLAKLLNDIRNGIIELQNNDETAGFALAMEQIISSKTMLDAEKIHNIDDSLMQLKSKIDSSADIAELTEQVQTLADNFRSGFNSVVTFANKDAEAKNLLLDRLNDLETAVKNGAMIESLRNRTDELVKGYENFISDSNLRHGNMVSTIVDLKNKLDEYSSKNNYTFGTIDHSINDTNNKITSLESTVSSSLGNVNSKLYSMGDDIQKILNDGFDHLKYLSSNISEAMNSSSLDVKTTLEVLKANVSDLSQNMKEELGNISGDITGKLLADSDVNKQIRYDILNNVKDLEQLFKNQSSEGENLLSEKVNNVIEFLTTLQSTLSAISSENHNILNDKLIDLSNRLQELNSGYENLIQKAVSEINSVSGTVERTSENILSKIENSDNEKFHNLKDELLTASSSNLNAITEKIQNITDTIDAYKNSTAERLTSYLTNIKDLFVEFSQRIENYQDSSEVLEKLANLEVLINKNNIERLETLINEQNISKEEKLSNIEVLLSRIDIEKNENFLQLQAILNKNSEAIEALNVRAGSLRGLEKIETLINEDRTIKDEKLTNLEILLSRIDVEKNEHFNNLQTLINENKNTLETIREENRNLNNTEKLETLINERSSQKDEKLDALKNLVDGYKESLDKLSEDILSKSEKSLIELAEIKTTANDILPKQSALNELSALVDNRIFECKNTLSEELTDVKKSISNITNEINSFTQMQNQNDFTEQLTGLNNQLTTVSENYEQAISVLGARLEEYVDLSERITTITKSKLDESANEISSLKLKFEDVSEQINTLIGNSGIIEILANIRQQFNVVSEQLQNERNGIVIDIQNSLVQNFDNIRSNILLIRQNIEDTQDSKFENVISNLNMMNSDLKLILSSIETAISEKFENITTSFKPLEDAIKDFIGINLSSAANEIKQQIELSYVNLRSELGDVINNNERFNHIETSYQTAVNKLTVLEEEFGKLNSENLSSVNNMLLNIHNLTESNLSLLEDVQASFHSDLIGLQTAIVENRNTISTTLKQELAELKELFSQNNGVDTECLRSLMLSVLDNEELINIIRGTNKALADKIYEFKQDNELAAQDILDVINSVSNTVNYILDLINEKFETASDNLGKILENINTLNDKLDVIIMANNDSEIKSDISNIDEKLNIIKNQLEIDASSNSELQLLTTKVDIIAESLDDDIISMDLEDIKNAIARNSENILQYQELVNLINQKIDIITQDNNDNITEYINPIKESVLVLKQDLTSTETKLENYLRAIDSTLDVLTSSHTDSINLSNNIDDVKQNIIKLRDKILTLDNKFDIIAQSSNDEILSEIEELKSSLFAGNKGEEVKKNFDELKEQLADTEYNLEGYARNIDCKLDEISQFTSVNEKLDNLKTDVKESLKLEGLINELNNKVDVIAQSSDDDILAEIDELKDHLYNADSKLGSIESNVKESLKLEDLINQLNNKVDILAMSDDSDVIDEIYGIRQLIEEQLETLQSSVEDSQNVQKLMDALNKIDSNITDIDFSRQTSDLKEAVISAIVTVTNEISFIEEADEIKDFVNEKTNELHRLLMDVKHQLHTITNTPDDMNMYSYTMQDVESDIAKLRLVVNDFAEKNANSELVVISTNLNKMARAMDDLRNAIIDVEIKRNAKNDINEIGEQIVSISSRLNQYILARRDFDTQIVEKLNLLFKSDNNTFADRIEKELTETNQKLDYTTNVITVLKNVMMYLGEWMDGTTETLTSIYDRTGKLSQLEGVKNSVSDVSLFNLIEGKFKQQESDLENLQNIVDNSVSQNDLKVDELQTIIENRILKQESRLERIENTLERITSILEASGSQIETRERIEKIEEKLAKLDANIEKLAAYVE